MATNIPTNTYDSLTDLSLGNIPQVDDPVIYQALLDLHNAIEILLTGSDDADAIFAAFIAKFRNNTPVVAADSPYTVLITDGTVEIDAAAGDVIVILHPVASGVGYRYDIKRIDTVTTSIVTLFGDTTGTPELVDGHSAGINISTLSSYTVKTNEAEDGWNIL